VNSVRGPGGGYTMAKDPSEITVAEVIRAVNEPVHTTMCENGIRGCHRGNRCDTHQLWEALGQHIYRFLDAVTIQQVSDGEVFLDRVELMDVSDYLEQPETVRVDAKIAAVS